MLPMQYAFKTCYLKYVLFRLKHDMLSYIEIKASHGILSSNMCNETQHEHQSMAYKANHKLSYVSIKKN